MGDEPKNKGANVINLKIQEPYLSGGGAFSDLVLVHSNPNNLLLTFVQRTPQGPKDKNAGDSGNVVSQINMSWPHFFRFVKMLNEIAMREKDKAVKNLDDTIKMFCGTSAEE